MQLRSLVETTSHNDESVILLEEALRRFHETVTCVEHFKQARDDTARLFQIQRSIANCPPTLCRPHRLFLTKMAAYEVEKGETNFSKRLTLYLFNDIMVGARKKRSKEGRIEKNSHIKKIHTHDFVFLTPIGGDTEIKRLERTAKARQRNTKTFSLNLGSDAEVWIRDRQLSISENSDNETIKRHYLLVPKSQDKLSMFLEKFVEAQHTVILADSAAELYMQRVSGFSLNQEDTGEEKDTILYFHVHKESDYISWPHKNRIAILYTDHAPLPDLNNILPATSCDALMFVQALNGAFRFHIKCREMLVAASDCFEPSREFHTPEQLERRFTLALSNCHLLYSIYPPFTLTMQLQMRHQLQQHIEPFSRGLFRKFREFANKLQKTKETIPIIDDGGSIYSVEANSIDFVDPFNSDSKVKQKKRSVLGKVLGKIKSPLSKLAEEF